MVPQLAVVLPGLCALVSGDFCRAEGSGEKPVSTVAASPDRLQAENRPEKGLLGKIRGGLGQPEKI